MGAGTGVGTGAGTVGSFESIVPRQQNSDHKFWDVRTPSSVESEEWGQTSSSGYLLWLYLQAFLRGLLWPFPYSKVQEFQTLCQYNFK